jgi:hypothetical protein
VHIHVLISPLYIRINILEYFFGRFWKYGLPVVAILDMEVFLSTIM